jgi:hypothetical protein
MKRFSRSDSSMIVASSSALASRVKRRVEVAQRAGRAQHRRQRRAQVVADRGQQRLPQAVGLGGALGPVEILHELTRSMARAAMSARASSRRRPPA